MPRDLDELVKLVTKFLDAHGKKAGVTVSLSEAQLKILQKHSDDPRVADIRSRARITGVAFKKR